MPGKVKVRILAARNLPVMDRSSDTTDAFAEVKLADVTFKTSVCQKTLHPVWNSDWFRFDVDDCDLQDEPLQIRIMDYDTYSANDAIGKVYIDLNPLLLKADSNRVSSDGQKQIMLSGWLPIFDTMHGVRGEVQVQVKVELFSDLNKFRTSSCGVLFFCSDVVPEGYSLKKMAFVEKLVINDDPEYQWIDKIRTPRASNEARQTLFMKLSSTVQRKIGLMALELGANAVLGYKQYFDMEGDTGIVVRGIGTAVTLVKQQAQPITQELTENKEKPQDNGKSLYQLAEHAQRVFQNLSMPWNQEEGDMLALPPPNSGVGLAWVGMQMQQQPEQAWPAGIVSTLTAAAADAAAAASIGRSSTSSSWLSRKPSFKAAAVSKLRAVSVTTMAAAAAVTNRSPSHHHRVGSAKSANSAKATLISRKNSETSLKFENLKNPSRMKHSASSHEVSSPCSSIASQDMSLPALESEGDCGNVVFDMTLTSKDSLSDENTSSRFENESILSFDESRRSSLQPICDGVVALSDPEAVSPIQDQVTSSNVVQDSPDSLISTFEESKTAFADESEWAKQALKMRRDKG